MSLESNLHTIRTRIMLFFVLISVIAAGYFGWRLGHSGVPTPTSGGTAVISNSSGSSATSHDVHALVGYTLPDGWKEGTCSGVANTQYIIPNGASLDCNANPSAPIKLYVDPQSTTDCQQLEGQQNVRKHICISMFINGHKSLKASTEYPESSTYSTNTTVSDYYINTGKGVVKVEYTFGSNNDYQVGFDQLATGIKVK